MPAPKEDLHSILTYCNNFAFEGVEYAATRVDKVLPSGTSEKAIHEMSRLSTGVATSTCNATPLAVAGYGFIQGPRRQRPISSRTGYYCAYASVLCS